MHLQKKNFILKNSNNNTDKKQKTSLMIKQYELTVLVIKFLVNKDLQLFLRLVIKKPNKPMSRIQAMYFTRGLTEILIFSHKKLFC